MSELIGKDRQEILKELLWRLHIGEAPEALVPEFKEKLGDVSPLEIAQIEQELVRAGIPRERSAGSARSTSPSSGSPWRRWSSRSLPGTPSTSLWPNTST